MLGILANGSSISRPGKVMVSFRELMKKNMKAISYKTNLVERVNSRLDLEMNKSVSSI